MFNKKVVKLLLSSIIGILCFYAVSAFGDGGANIGKLASDVTGSLDSIAKLITGGAYLAGFVMVVISLFKFKQHKDNPQQAPLSTCMVLLLVGVGLVFLPSIISVGGASVFGSSAKSSNISGTSNF